ncbi:rRNA maturation RNase YbeY [Telmatospirillum sp.]|uniref:rRNA maturation RNase YbeY n=1 Tax=Telmatospirillum sp. TaxID=2079197 RepID=UPI00284BEE2F|nr:rRNA maturation RNase YbeY [Telmatospirillum sp.]MDR3440422.1 rRNA maturation RNase YbeY [Telmatospirillum sp.]
MSAAVVAISQPCADWGLALPEAEALCRRAALAALAGAAEALPPVAEERLEISLVLADNAMVQELNRQYRGQDKPTNVLSFAALDDEDDVLPEDGPLLLGDVILAFETTAAEARTEDKALADHLAHLVVHGVLHLLGYDHLEEDEAEEMEAAERSILAGLGIADPYAVPPPS